MKSGCRVGGEETNTVGVIRKVGRGRGRGGLALPVWLISLGLLFPRAGEAISRSPRFSMEQHDAKQTAPEHWHSDRRVSAGAFMSCPSVAGI